MDRAHVLIVEDELKTAETVALYLRDAGYRTSLAHDGEEGLRMARGLAPDLVLLDRMLPRLDGTEVCRQLRSDGSIPIIMLTARTTEEERIEGFDLGADDYVSKPFSPRELVRRVEALLRRTRAMVIDGPGRLSFDGLVLDLARRELRIEGQLVALTPTEYRLLEALMRAPNRVFERGELIERAFGHDFEGEERTVDVHVKNLRRKIDLDAQQAPRIRTVFGAGYRLGARHEAP